MGYDLTAELAITLVMYGLYFFMGIAVLMAFFKAIQNSCDAYYEHQLKRSVDAIHLFLDHPADNLLIQIKKNTHVRDYIVSLMDKISGEERANIRLLYERLRFYQRDLRDLKNPYYKRRLFALGRLLRLREKISRKTIDRMLDDSFPIVRWQAMEYLIQMEGKRSLSNLLYFTHRYYSKDFIGVIYHLIGLYASIDREGVVFLLQHTQEEELILALMKVMEEYPHPSSGDAIWEVLKAKSHHEVIISGLKILSSAPDERYFSLLDLMHAHDFWVIRMYVAKKLVNYQTLDSYSLLEKLSNDSEYLVRSAACATLITLNMHESNRFISTVLKQRDHPSYQIMKNQVNLITFYH